MNNNVRAKGFLQEKAICRSDSVPRLYEASTHEGFIKMHIQ